MAKKINNTFTNEELLKYYEKMFLIRKFEEKAGQLYGAGKIGGFCHLYIGQEAVVTGILSSIKSEDTVVTSYRDHGHILARGVDPKFVMAELTGRKDGISKGKGGSMHMFSKAIRFYGRFTFNKESFMNLKLTLLCLSLISIPTISFSADEDVSVFDEIVVSARKRAELSQSVPIPISALNEEQLEMRNIVELTDIEKLAPNLSIQLGAVNSTVLEVFMRGIGQSNWAVSHDPKIGLYTDGVYSARPQGGLVDLYDIQSCLLYTSPSPRD